MDEKIVLIGAGSAMFTRGVVSDLINSNMKVELALVDSAPEALNAAYCLAQKMIAARDAPIKLDAFIEREKAFPGATVVISTIGVGGRRAWEKDVFIPRKYGLYYPVGDTVGPGGTSRAMRMIPAMVAIARDVVDIAPEALFFNYANPMSPVCRSIHKFTGANVIGLCIGTWETVEYLAHVLGAQIEELSYSASGINHMTWFSNIRVRDHDAMPELHEIAAKKISYVSEIVEKSKNGQAKIPHCGSPYDSSFDFPFSWWCLKYFDAFPAPMDRHVAEFFPQLFRDGKYYNKILGVDEFSFEETIAEGDQIYNEMLSDALSPEPLTQAYFEKLEGEQEQVIEIIQAIRQNKTSRFFANLPNRGQAPDLPAGAVIEAPSVTDNQGLHAIIQKPLPTAVAGTLATRFQWVETVVEAAIEGSRAKFIDALILDGGVQSPDQAVALADELILAQGLISLA